MTKKNQTGTINDPGQLSLFDVPTRSITTYPQAVLGLDLPAHQRLPPAGQRRWTAEELEILGTHTDCVTSELADLLPGRTFTAIDQKRRKTNLSYIPPERESGPLKVVFTRSPGIYCKRNIIGGKIYVGSTVDLRIRQQEHDNQLGKGIHHSFLLQRRTIVKGRMPLSGKYWSM